MNQDLRKKKQKTVLLVGAIGLVVIAVIALIAKELLDFSGEYTVEGTLTWIDPEKREASLEFRNPWNEELVEKTATVPESCTITRDGEPIGMEQLSSGDQVTVTAYWDAKKKEFSLLAVQVDQTPTTQPST